MDTRIMRRCGVVAVLLLCAAAIIVEATTITVTNTNDSGPGSLRQALADADDGDSISFDSSLNGQSIILTGGELLVDKSITISGPGADNLATPRAACCTWAQVKPSLFLTWPSCTAIPLAQMTTAAASTMTMQRWFSTIARSAITPEWAVASRTIVER